VAQTDLATLQQERARDALLCFQNVLQLEQQAVDVLVTAGKAIVQLAAKHDQLVSPTVLFQLAVLLRHPDPTVRVGMLRKLHKSFERGQIALKFAALLPLSAVDPVKEYQQLAMATLKQVVKVRAQFGGSVAPPWCVVAGSVSAECMFATEHSLSPFASGCPRPYTRAAG
jgi:hypothetical protein